MAQSKVYASLEVGTDKVVFAIAEFLPRGGEIKILALEQVVSSGIQTGEIRDVQKVKQCIKQALLKAEDKSKVAVKCIHVVIAGKGYLSINQGAKIDSPEPVAVNSATIKAIDTDASSHRFSKSYQIIHKINRGYVLDGNYSLYPPLKLEGRELRSSFHIIAYQEKEINNRLLALEELEFDIDQVIFSPIASAQLLLDNKEYKQEGALLIDIGAGTTDYILYHQSKIEASGSLPIGGDHITNDISVFFNCSFSKAEEIKKNYVDLAELSKMNKVKIKDPSGFSDFEIDAKDLYAVVDARLQDIFDYVKESIKDTQLAEIKSGIFLTGGTALMKGLVSWVENYMKIEVNKASVNKNLSGFNDIPWQDPRYSSVIGVLRYIQEQEQNKKNSQKKTGLFKFFT